MKAGKTGVVLMSYGTPSEIADVEPYYQRIRGGHGGHGPTPEQVKELADRYRAIGGRTPLLDITQRAALALEEILNAPSQRAFRVYVGMKFWHPLIGDTVRQMVADGVTHIIGLALAPHFSEMSTGGYRSAIEDALRDLPNPPTCTIVESWHGNPLFIQFMAKRVKNALAQFPASERDNVQVMFSAHSLPKRIQQWGDPYPDELHKSCEAVAAAAGLPGWKFTFQSAGRTRDPWLGPDILETLGLTDFSDKAGVLMVPIGFVCDNLEILYDIDVQAQELARNIGLVLRRTPMPNDDPEFIAALADIVVNGTGTRMGILGAPAGDKATH